MKPHLPYDRLTRDALRGILREVLRLVAKDGLPGEHHFFISFEPSHEDCRLPAHLATPPDGEMTIVLQHQFRNLKVSDAAFSVTLQFQGKPHALVIPFAAVTSFFDPVEPFGLRLETLNLNAPLQVPIQTPAQANDRADTPAGSPAGAVVRLDAFRANKPSQRVTE